MKVPSLVLEKDYERIKGRTIYLVSFCVGSTRNFLSMDGGNMISPLCFRAPGTHLINVMSLPESEDDYLAIAGRLSVAACFTSRSNALKVKKLYKQIGDKHPFSEFLKDIDRHFPDPSAVLKDDYKRSYGLDRVMANEHLYHIFITQKVSQAFNKDES